mmetsp:Transcript_120682/g.313352  ORF Transcript_120682/g.313352 Transcript_120682/m.313352 type:complete len:383 (-) Transcript_120682:192-1340(-)
MHVDLRTLVAGVRVIQADLNSLIVNSSINVDIQPCTVDEAKQYARAVGYDSGYVTVKLFGTRARIVCHSSFDAADLRQKLIAHFQTQHRAGNTIASSILPTATNSSLTIRSATMALRSAVYSTQQCRTFSGRNPDTGLLYFLDSGNQKIVFGICVMIAGSVQVWLSSCVARPANYNRMQLQEYLRNNTRSRNLGDFVCTITPDLPRAFRFYMQKCNTDRHQFQSMTSTTPLASRTAPPAPFGGAAAAAAGTNPAASESRGTARARSDTHMSLPPAERVRIHSVTGIDVDPDEEGIPAPPPGFPDISGLDHGALSPTQPYPAGFVHPAAVIEGSATAPSAGAAAVDAGATGPIGACGGLLNQSHESRMRAARLQQQRGTAPPH